MPKSEPMMPISALTASCVTGHARSPRDLHRDPAAEDAPFLRRRTTPNASVSEAAFRQTLRRLSGSSLERQKRTAIASIGEATAGHAALYRVVIVRMRTSPADPRFTSKSAKQMAKAKWKIIPLSQAIRGPRDLRLFYRRSTIRCLRFESHLTDIGASTP